MDKEANKRIVCHNLIEKIYKERENVDFIYAIIIPNILCNIDLEKANHDHGGGGNCVYPYKR